MEKVSSTKLVPGAKKIEDRCPKTLAVVVRLHFKKFICVSLLFLLSHSPKFGLRSVALFRER